MAASYLLPGSPLFGRYPAGFYLLAMPLNVLFDVANIPYSNHRQSHRQRAVGAGLVVRCCGR